MRLHGEAADVNLIAAEEEVSKIRDLLEEYDLELIFNTDESGNIFALLFTIFLNFNIIFFFK